MRGITALVLLMPVVFGVVCSDVVAQKRGGAAGAIRNLGGSPDHDDDGAADPRGRSSVRIGANSDGGFGESIDGFDFDADSFEFDVDELREAVREMEGVKLADLDPLTGTSAAERELARLRAARDRMRGRIDGVGRMEADRLARERRAFDERWGPLAEAVAEGDGERSAADWRRMVGEATSRRRREASVPFGTVRRDEGLPLPAVGGLDPRPSPTAPATVPTADPEAVRRSERVNALVNAVRRGERPANMPPRDWARLRDDVLGERGTLDADEAATRRRLATARDRELSPVSGAIDRAERYLEKVRELEDVLTPDQREYLHRAAAWRVHQARLEAARRALRDAEARAEERGDSPSDRALAVDPRGRAPGANDPRRIGAIDGARPVGPGRSTNRPGPPSAEEMNRDGLSLPDWMRVEKIDDRIRAKVGALENELDDTERSMANLDRDALRHDRRDVRSLKAKLEARDRALGRLDHPWYAGLRRKALRDRIAELNASRDERIARRRETLEDRAASLALRLREGRSRLAARRGASDAPADGGPALLPDLPPFIAGSPMVVPCAVADPSELTIEVLNADGETFYMPSAPSVVGDEVHLVAPYAVGPFTLRLSLDDAAVQEIRFQTIIPPAPGALRLEKSVYAVGETLHVTVDVRDDRTFAHYADPEVQVVRVAESVSGGAWRIAGQPLRTARISSVNADVSIETGFGFAGGTSREALAPGRYELRLLDRDPDRHVIDSAPFSIVLPEVPGAIRTDRTSYQTFEPIAIEIELPPEWEPWPSRRRGLFADDGPVGLEVRRIEPGGGSRRWNDIEIPFERDGPRRFEITLPHDNEGVGLGTYLVPGGYELLLVTDRHVIDRTRFTVDEATLTGALRVPDEPIAPNDAFEIIVEIPAGRSMPGQTEWGEREAGLFTVRVRDRRTGLPWAEWPVTLTSETRTATANQWQSTPPPPGRYSVELLVQGRVLETREIEVAAVAGAHRIVAASNRVAPGGVVRFTIEPPLPAEEPVPDDPWGNGTRTASFEVAESALFPSMADGFEPFDPDAAFALDALVDFDAEEPDFSPLDPQELTALAVPGSPGTYEIVAPAEAGAYELSAWLGEVEGWVALPVTVATAATRYTLAVEPARAMPGQPVAVTVRRDPPAGDPPGEPEVAVVVVRLPDPPEHGPAYAEMIVDHRVVEAFAGDATTFEIAEVSSFGTVRSMRAGRYEVRLWPRGGAEPIASVPFEIAGQAVAGAIAPRADRFDLHATTTVDLRLPQVAELEEYEMFIVPVLPGDPPGSARRRAYGYRFYADRETPRVFSTLMFDEPGDHRVELVGPSGFTVDRANVTLDAPFRPDAIRLDREAYAHGETIEVTVTLPEQLLFVDVKVVIVRAAGRVRGGARVPAWQAWRFGRPQDAPGTGGTLTFEAPEAPGFYEFWLLDEDRVIGAALCRVTHPERPFPEHLDASDAVVHRVQDEAGADDE